jgi:hypothetical protein
MTNVSVLFLCLSLVVNVNAFFSKIYVRNKIIRDIRYNRKWATDFLSVNSDPSITNVTKVVDDKLEPHFIYKLVCKDQNIKDIFVGYTAKNIEYVLKNAENICNNIERKEYNCTIY